MTVSHRYRFASFDFAADRFELRCSGDVVPAEPKVLELLAHFLRHRDRVVTKDELLEEVWDGAFVSDSALSRAVGELRRVFATGPEGDAAKQWIRTVYGRGFSYRGPEVAELDRSPAPEDRATEDRVPSTRRTSRLPSPLTPLIGRDDEVERLVGQLGKVRLLTLSGPGGTGKTRLALEVARRAEEQFADGAVFVPLSEITTREGLALALAMALGVREPGGRPFDAVRSYLAGREILLVLDNFEQLVEAAVALPEWLGSSPGTVALVTSRFVLQVEGEHEWPVPPLSLARPDSGAEELAEAPAVQLFTARARAVDPSFRAEGENLSYVAEICRRLDGLPLAIELAAARIKLFPPRQLWERLAERFDLLSSPARDRHRRHRSLYGALNWSYELLEPDEQRLFRRLAVFAGGFPLSAVPAVCSGAETRHQLDADVLDVLAALVDRSLVSRGPDSDAASSEPRFHLLETARDFAWEQLREAGEDTHVRRRHVRWVRDLARTARQDLDGSGQGEGMRRLDAERDNFLAALHFARDDTAHGGVHLCGLAAAAALGRYWTMRSYTEGRSLLEALLAASPRGEASDRTHHSEALTALGTLCHLIGDYDAAKDHLGRALDMWRRAEDPSGIAQVLDHLSWIAAQRTELDRAEKLSRQALELHLEQNDRRATAVAYNNLGWVRFYRGALGEAEDYFERSVDFRRRAGDDRGAAFALINLALTRIHRVRAESRGLLAGQHDLEDADRWLAEAEELLPGIDDRPLEGWLRTVHSQLQLDRGAAAESAAAIRQTVDATREHQNHDGLAWAHLFLGEAEMHAGLPDAKTNLETSRRSAIQLSSRWTEMEALRLLAELAVQEGRPSAARDLYAQSLALAEEHGVELTAAACRQQLEALPPDSGPAKE